MPTRKLQNPDDFRGQKFYVGIDVHKKSWAVAVRSDSRSLAFNLEKGNLHGIFIMPRQQQEFRALFRLRETKARDMARAIKPVFNNIGVVLVFTSPVVSVMLRIQRSLIFRFMLLPCSNQH